MQAQNRYLPEWFNRINSRQLTLPRFQRFIAWGHGEVAGLLTTVLRGLPSGAALILEVGDKEKFLSRTLTDAPEKGNRVTEQLLDGQQRLTALWRSLNDKYTNRTYLVAFEEDLHDANKQLPVVHGIARWEKDGKKYPLWVDDPIECWERKFIPLKLLRPEDISDEINDWIEKATPKNIQDKFGFYKQISGFISELRIKVREFNLPYLSLPPNTEKEVALDVFVKMNTSSVRLTTYDIVVALVEGETGQSLHDHVITLLEQVPRVSEYTDAPSLVLDVVALKQNRVPGEVGYQGINFQKMITDWPTVISGIRGLISFLEEESVFDAQRLPSYTALPVVAALWESLPSQPDQLGNARYLLRKYLWHAFLTSRYEQSSSSNALQDFRALKAQIENAESKPAPIFDKSLYPLPSVERIMQEDWPKRKSIVSRGLLALQIKAGAEDLADGAKATVVSITSKDHPREYHHLFPASKLSEAELSQNEIFRAVNCALITWKTNRTISNKDPVQYLKDRSNNSALGEDELKRRLRSHLIPYDELNVGAYTADSVEKKKEEIRKDYIKFCYKRAQLLAKAAEMACSGSQLDLVSEVFKSDAE